MPEPVLIAYCNDQLIITKIIPIIIKASPPAMQYEDILFFEKLKAAKPKATSKEPKTFPNTPDLKRTLASAQPMAVVNNAR